MGGQAFKCKQCQKWSMNAGSLRDHKRSAHNIGNHNGAVESLPDRDTWGIEV